MSHCTLAGAVAIVAAIALPGCTGSELDNPNPARLYLAAGGSGTKVRLAAEEPPPY